MYVAVIGLVTIAAGWCTVIVGKTMVSAIEARVIDGSGKADSDDDLPSLTPSPPTSPTVVTAISEPPKPALEKLDVVPPKPSSDDPHPDPAAQYLKSGEVTYKTYCVRLCDGYFWPISFATTPDRFERDQATCNSACGSPARLFVHRIPGGGPGTMVSLDGLPYSALNTAFQFRARYDAQCRCQPQPWEQQAKDRHRLYAAEQALKAGSTAAAANLVELKQKVASADAAADAGRSAANETATRELAALGRRVELTPPPRKRLRQNDFATTRQATTTSTTVRAEDLPEDETMKGGWRATSGSGRGWKTKGFSGN
ncbi:MAG: DUF2865 domain-containing protein [Proteobacteria bacterium]|nr:DUF2865 domain-containing protein [Pseudomonadota bacterium]